MPIGCYVGATVILAGVNIWYWQMVEMIQQNEQVKALRHGHNYYEYLDQRELLMAKNYQDSGLGELCGTVKKVSEIRG